MNKLILVFFFLATSHSLCAQMIRPIVFKRGKTAYVAHKMSKKKPNRKYAMDKFSAEFDHTLHLLNDSVIGANSDIMLDAETGKYYLYFVDAKGALKKIYPEDTQFITHSNPYDDDADEIVGYPTEDRWLFTINEGKINTFAYSCTAHKIDFYSIGDGELKPFTALQELPDLLEKNKKATALFRKKEYYKAIAVYNEGVE